MLILSNFLIFLSLCQFQLILKPSELVRRLIKFLLQRGAISYVVLTQELKPLVQNRFLPLELLVLLIYVQYLLLMLLLELFSALLSLLLHLCHMHIVVRLSFVLRVRLLASDLVDSRLELLRVFLHVPFVLVTLLLQELVLSFPERGFLIVLVDLIL